MVQFDGALGQLGLFIKSVPAKVKCTITEVTNEFGFAKGVTVAMANKVGLSKVGATIHPYPTQAEAIRKLGDQFNRTKLTPTSKKLLNFLRKLNVGS